MPMVPDEFSAEHAEIRLETFPAVLTTEMRLPELALVRRRLVALGAVGLGA